MGWAASTLAARSLRLALAQLSSPVVPDVRLGALAVAVAVVLGTVGSAYPARRAVRNASDRRAAAHLGLGVPDATPGSFVRSSRAGQPRMRRGWWRGTWSYRDGLVASVAARAQLQHSIAAEQGRWSGINRSLGDLDRALGRR